jgi:hypothetical protein
MAQVMGQYCRAAAYLLGMGDLQCPARVYVADAVAADLARGWLSHERIAGIHRLDGTTQQVRAQLEDIADRHRGEAVLVVGEPDVVSAALRGWVAGWRADATWAPDALVALEADADGWRLVGR